MLLRGDGGSGYIRVDWFTPDGLATWGDGRLTILGTDGYIELRKYVDIARSARRRPPVPGRPAADALHRLPRRGAAVRAAAAGRRPPSHRDGHAPGARLSGLRARPARASPGAQRARPRGGGRMTGPPARRRRRRWASAARTCAATPGRRPLRRRRRVRHRPPARRRRRRGARHRRASSPTSPSCAAWTTWTSSTSARRRTCTSTQIQQVLDAGKHAICEKPLVSSLREVDELIARRGRLGPTDHADLPVPLRPRHAEAQAADRATVSPGTPYLGTVETAWRRRPAYYAVPWRGKWATERGGALLEPRDPQPRPAVLRARRAAAAVRLHHHPRQRDRGRGLRRDRPGDGRRLGGVARASRSARQQEITRHRFSFSGLVAESNTRPYTNSGDPWTFVGDSPELDEQIAATLAEFRPLPEHYAGQFYRFYDALQTGGELPVTLADARRSIELITAMYYSAETGQSVTFPLARIIRATQAGCLPALRPIHRQSPRAASILLKGPPGSGYPKGEAAMISGRLPAWDDSRDCGLAGRVRHGDQQLLPRGAVLRRRGPAAGSQARAPLPAAEALRPPKRALVNRYMQDHPNVDIEYLSTTSLSGPSDTDAIANLIFNIQAKKVIDVAKIEVSRTPLDLMASELDPGARRRSAATRSRPSSRACSTTTTSTSTTASGCGRRAATTGIGRFCQPERTSPTRWFLTCTSSSRSGRRTAGGTPTSERHDDAAADDLAQVRGGRLQLRFHVAAPGQRSEDRLARRADSVHEWRTGTHTTYGGGSALAIPTTAAHPKEAMDFIMWLTSDDGQRLKYNATPGLGLADQDVYSQANPDSMAVSNQLKDDSKWQQSILTGGLARRAGSRPAIHPSGREVFSREIGYGSTRFSWTRSKGRKRYD